MKGTILVMVMITAPWPALAQTALAPEGLFDSVTCQQFSAMEFGAQEAALQALPSAGDAMSGEDAGAVEQWTRTVEAGCLKQPDKLLADVAAALLGGD